MLLRVPLRRALTVRIALAGLLGAVAVSACIVTALAHREPVLPRGAFELLPPAPSPELVSRLQPPPAPARRATLNLMVRATDKGFEQDETYELVVGVHDPLLASLRTGAVGQHEVSRYVLGRSIYPASDVFTVDQPAGSATATIRIQTRIISFSNEHLLIAPFATSQQLGLAVPEMSVTITVEQARITTVQGATPTSQTATTVTFDGPPRKISVGAHRTTPLPAGLDTDEPTGVDTSWIYWPLVKLIPWFILLWASRVAHGRTRAMLRTAGLGAIAITVVVGGLAVAGDFLPTSGLAFGLTAVATPFLVSGWLRRASGSSGWPTWYRIALMGFGFSVIAFLAWLAGAGSFDELPWRGRPWVVLGLAVLCGLCTGGAARILTRKASVAWAFAVAGFATCVAVVGLSLLQAALSGHLDNSSRPLSTVVLGLLWAPVVLAGLHLIDFRTARARRRAYAMGLAGSALLLFPIALLVTSPETVGLGNVVVWLDATGIAMTGLNLANLALAAGIIVFLVRHNASDSVTRRLGMALAVLATPTGAMKFVDVVTGVVTVAAFAWLLPAGRQARAARLARVAQATHARLISAESWRRLTLRAGLQHFRAARQTVGETPAELARLRADQRDIDRSGGWLRLRTANGIYLPEAALGSAAGQTARRNAAAAVLVGLALALPLTAYEMYHGFGPVGPLEHLPMAYWMLDAWPSVRWAVYALIFGYFYPWMRGGVPVNKALALLGALALVETTRLIGTMESASLADFGIAGAIRVGQATVFCLGLALFWERRTVNAGGLPWGRIRDLRTLQALGTPVTTVVVAGLTTVATALAGAAVMAMLTPAPQQPPNTGEPSPSPSVGGR